MSNPYLDPGVFKKQKKHKRLLCDSQEIQIDGAQMAGFSGGEQVSIENNPGA